MIVDNDSNNIMSVDNVSWEAIDTASWEANDQLMAALAGDASRLQTADIVRSRSWGPVPAQ
jgi:hypothetical protein